MTALLIALMFAGLSPQSVTSAPVAPGPAGILDKSRIRQDELSAKWRQYDFIEEEVLVHNPPDTKHPKPYISWFRIHHVGNYELAMLTQYDGKAPAGELAEKWDKYYAKTEKALEQHPVAATEYGDRVTSSVAATMLRLLKPEAVTTTGDGDFVLTVATDSDAWARSIWGNWAKAPHMTGSIRVDGKTFELKELSLSDAASYSQGGGVTRIAPDSTFHYVQTRRSGETFPDRYESVLQFKTGLGKWRTQRYTATFSGFKLAAASPPAKP
jgi:hypothetical protein